jgi:hypothetical protein
MEEELTVLAKLTVPQKGTKSSNDFRVGALVVSFFSRSRKRVEVLL